MSKFCILLFYTLIYFISSATSTPILDSEDVGTVWKGNGKVVVSGQTLYPYVARIETIIRRNGKSVSEFCMGVIIGFDAVLTAGHCLHGRVNPKIIIHVGIVDVERESEAGQKIEAKDFLVHNNYEEECNVGPDHYCFNVNDIAIVWTEKKFRIGPKVKIAVLNKIINKPVDKKGYIVGWGLNGKPELPTMLQRGLLKVVGKEECHNFNREIIIPDTVMCLAPVTGKTRATRGDSGGPFVIDGVVYGISSITIFESPQRKKTMDLFTYVAGHSMWLDINLLQGAPKERTPKTSRKPATSRRRTQSN